MNEPSSLKTTTNNFDHGTDFQKKLFFVLKMTLKLASDVLTSRPERGIGNWCRSHEN